MTDTSTQAGSPTAQAATITIDGRQVTARSGQTVLEAALGNGIDIPHVCYHADVGPIGSCRLCIVEIEGINGLPTSCTTPVADGMVVRTETEQINKLRRALLELLLLKGERSARLEELQQLAQRQQVIVAFRERRELDRLAGHSHHQGVLLQLEPFKYCDLTELRDRWQASDRSAFFLLLDGITDPHNFGAILRSAEVAGCHGVIVAKDRACSVTPVVEKTAAGALSHLPLCQVTNLSRVIDELKQSGVWCYGLAGEEGATDLFETDLTGNLALVVGSEGKGLRENIRKHCDGLLAIPMQGQVGSLNASVAAAIALFEVVRQSKTI